jgi:hypothetical protein
VTYQKSPKFNTPVELREGESRLKTMSEGKTKSEADWVSPATGIEGDLSESPWFAAPVKLHDRESRLEILPEGGTTSEAD